MDSPLLIEYMRTGTIRPLAKGDTKNQVESKLGPPDDWKGRIPHIGWTGPPLTDFHDSWGWHYGSLCICFPEPFLYGLPGVSLDYTEITKPIHFPHPFTDLPSSSFTIRDLIDLLEHHGVEFEDLRPDRVEGLILTSEGGVAVTSRDRNCSPKALVGYLFPHEFKRT